MRLLLVDEEADELEKVGDVARDQAAALPGRVAELLEIAAASLADLMRTGGIKATFPQQRDDAG